MFWGHVVAHHFYTWFIVVSHTDLCNSISAAVCQQGGVVLLHLCSKARRVDYWQLIGVALSDRQSKYISFYAPRLIINLRVSLPGRSVTYLILRRLRVYQGTSPDWPSFAYSVGCSGSTSFLPDVILNRIKRIDTESSGRQPSAVQTKLPSETAIDTYNSAAITSIHPARLCMEIMWNNIYMNIICRQHGLEGTMLWASAQEGSIDLNFKVT